MVRSRWRKIGTACVALLVAIVSAGIWFVWTHRDSRTTTAAGAEAEFDRLRSEVSRISRGSGPIRAFHTVIFDTRGGDRLVRVTAPLWLARRYARHDGEFRWLGELTFFDDTEFDSQPVRLSLSEIERHGAGVIADYRRPDGGQFLSWVE